MHDTEEMSVYTSHVSSAFLAKFDKLGEPSCVSMDIYRQRVQFHPYDAVAARLAAAIGDDVWSVRISTDTDPSDLDSSGAG